MSSNRQQRLILGIAVSILVSACGGGGSSSDATVPVPPLLGEPQAPVMNYTGNRQPITVDQTNAARLASRAFSIRSIVQSIEPLWEDSPQTAISTEGTVTGQVGGEVYRRINTDNNGRGFAEATFFDFSDAHGETINGRIVLRYRPESGQAGPIDYSFAGPGSIEFDNLTILVDQAGVFLHGTVGITGPDSDRFHVNLQVSDPQATESIYFEQSSIQFSTVDVGGVPRPALEIEGTVYEENEGSLIFSSLGPTPDLGFSELAGHFVGGAGGGIELVSPGPTTHVRPISFAFASVVMDLDGNGEPETAKRFSWPELAGAQQQESSVMLGPIANAGQTRTPDTSMPVAVHGLFSHDDDGDWLTFDWEVIARPPGSQIASDQFHNSPFFQFSPDAAGDYVLKLRASDGINASHTSVLIRHAPAEYPDQYDVPKASLEVASPINAAMPFIIDGSSALSWPYNQPHESWHRTGFGLASFSDTGQQGSTFVTIDEEGINEVRYSANSEFGGAPGTNASITFAVGPRVFETEIEIPGDANAFDIHAVDFDADGDEDLVLRIGQHGSERISIWLASPSGLTPGPDVPAGLGELAIGDVNGDGLTDILSAAADGLLLFRQQADHTLVTPEPIAFPSRDCGANGGAIDIGLVEIDGNAGQDVVAVHPCGDALVSWLQQPDGRFGSPREYSLENHRISTAVFGDISGDGIADAVIYADAVSTAYDEGAAVFISQSDGTYVEQLLLPEFDLGRSGIGIGDMNNDGRKDVVVVSRTEVLLLAQQSDGSLLTSTVFTDVQNDFSRPAVSIVDMDGDGFRDVFICDPGRLKRLLVQSPDGSLRNLNGPSCPNLNLNQAENAAAYDVNGDSIRDLVTTTTAARGSIDERVLLSVFLQGIQLYPVPE